MGYRGLESIAKTINYIQELYLSTPLQLEYRSVWKCGFFIERSICSYLYINDQR